MVKGKRLRALAVVADQPLTIEGVGTIEPITKTLANFPKITTAFGIFIPKGVPQEVVTTMDRVWDERVAKSEKIKQYAQQKGALFTPAAGKQAYDIVWPTVVEDAYMLQEAGMAKVSPESIGIKR
jgi:tripartite-type tricarboxylate transporter receptor subunit TctC